MASEEWVEPEAQRDGAEMKSGGVKTFSEWARASVSSYTPMHPDSEITKRGRRSTLQMGEGDARKTMIRQVTLVSRHY